MVGNRKNKQCEKSEFIFFFLLYRVAHVSMNLFAINHGLTTVSVFLFNEAIHQQSVYLNIESMVLLRGRFCIILPVSLACQ